ncbi:MAG: TIGR00304 family membrane protein [Candidatus Bathycorpusculaceae bacterium]
MTEDENKENTQNGRLKVFLTLFFIGFFIILVGALFLAAATMLSKGTASIGGVIFIGPIPIAFGAGPEAQWLILFAIILGVLSIIMLFILRKKS